MHSFLRGVECRGQLVRIYLVVGILCLRNGSAGLFTNVDNAAIEFSESTWYENWGSCFPARLGFFSSLPDGHTVHKSLIDYLLDFTRSGHLPFDLAPSSQINRKTSPETCQWRAVRPFQSIYSSVELSKMSRTFKIIVSMRISMIHTYSLWRSHIPCLSG